MDPARERFAAGAVAETVRVVIGRFFVACGVS